MKVCSMTKPSTPVLILTLAAALGAEAAGCDRIWPSSSETASKETSKPAPSPPVPAATASIAASPAPEPPKRMTPNELADFDAWMIKTYLACWKPAAQPADSDPYVAQVRLAFRPDGSLAKPPKLVNPPSDPAMRPQAKSVMQAVQTCNPLPVPAQYRPFYEQWRTKTIHFNPQVAVR
jgi:colicin import membrane protein